MVVRVPRFISIGEVNTIELCKSVTWKIFVSHPTLKFENKHKHIAKSNDALESAGDISLHVFSFVFLLILLYLLNKVASGTRTNSSIEI